MINTKKKIHIYNRFRAIYASKNKYYIRYNKKYIDLYTIIKKADTKALHHKGGGDKKSDKTFLTQELANIKNGIVIFKLLMDDKQSEAINIYINLIELINSKRQVIINKINTYPQNHFDKELNKAAMITYVKSVLYDNIFNNYLINIIPRIDLKDFIKESNRDVIENIIKSLLHFNNTTDKRVAQDIMSKIEKYNDILASTIKTNCGNYDTLKDIIGKYIEDAIATVEGADKETEDEEDTEEADGADAGAAEGTVADGAEGTEGTEGTEADASGTEGTAIAVGKEKKEKKEKKGKEGEQEEIKKVIYDDMIAIKEGLDNLDNKDYVDRLLPVLEKELDYYVMFIDIGTGFDETEELNKYFDNINNFLIQYKELYDEYIQYNKKELVIKEQELTKKKEGLSKNKLKLKAKESALKISKKELEEKQKELNNIKKAKDEEDEKAQNGTDTQASSQPQQGDGQGAEQSGGDGETGGEADVEADGEAEETDYDKKIDDLKKNIKVNKDQYSNIIKEIREVKICINGLDKDIEKINKRIDVIKKKIKQYEEFSEKIVILSNKIKAILKTSNIKATKAVSRASTENEYNNITLYKKYIETVIFNIKSKILYYFIINYIQYCKDLNNTREKNKGEDQYDKLNKEIENFYNKKKDAEDTQDTDDASQAAAPGAPQAAAPAADDIRDTPGAGNTAPGVVPAAPVASVVPVANKQSLLASFGNGGAGVGSVSGGGKGRASVCAYLTDVEGNLDFFEKYVSISKVIEWVDSKKNRLRFKQKDSLFVFGGDCQDRGIGDIRFVNLLLNFKSEYPDRVEFIIGNRDANKIRIYSELSEKIADEGKYLAKYDNFPYWVNKDERITLRKYLENNNYKINTVSRLKYILDYTMGSYDSFDKRRKELSIILNKSPDSISDKDIVSSFLNSVSPHPANIKNTNDNYILKYLKSGKIAYIFGEHIFIHGSVNKNNVGYIPNNKNIVDNVEKWVSGLNKWFQKDLKEYMANPEYGGISKRRKGYKIIDYAVPSDNKSVVYSDNLKNGNGQYINSKVIKYLNKGGIHSIISGHRPHGDCPLVLRSKKLTAVSADTSYSKKGHRSKWGVDNRGNAVSEVLLYLNGDIQIHGILQDNRKYDYIINNKDTKPDKSDKSHHKYDKYIGLQLKNNYWVKNVRYEKNAKNGKNAKYLISYAKGFESEEKWITETELLKLL
jgi:hypothetical protein